MKKLITLLLVGMLGLLALIAASAEEASPKLVLSETEVRVAVGKSVSLKATVENPSAGKKGKATWESSDPAVCTVSASGAVRAVSEGTAIISCTQELPEDGILTAVCSVTTFTEAKSLKPVNRDIRLNVGETVQAEYTLLPEETTEKMLDWISANEAVVTVNAEGKLTAVGPGTVKVTAQTRDGSNKKAEFTVYVPTMSVAETEYTISELDGVTIPIGWYGEDYDKDFSISFPERQVMVTTRLEGNRIMMHLDALEQGDGKIVLINKKDNKAKITLTVHTEESAVCDNVLVEITSVTLQWKKGELLLVFSFMNHSSLKVTGLTYAVDFRTASGEQVFFPKTFEGQDVPSVGQYFHGADSAMGQPYKPHTKFSRRFYPTINDVRIFNQEISEVRCAICRIDFEDGSFAYIPDKQLYWFSSLPGEGYLEKPAVRENYVAPNQEIQDKAASFQLGWGYTKVITFLQAWYGVSKTGMFVTHIEPDSIAEKCGLQLKDLVFEVDGISYAENNDMVILGKAKMADGETVIFKILRDGEILELAFHQ